MKTCCSCGVRCPARMVSTFLSAERKKLRRRQSKFFFQGDFERRKEKMPVVDVVNLEGKKVGQVELADAIFAAKVNEHLLHEASRWYLAGLRRGTHKVKEKSEVSGAGRKLWKQKGTGRARIG